MPKKVKPEGILPFETPEQVYSTCVQIDDEFHYAGTIGDMEGGRLKSPKDFKQQTAEVLRKMIDLLSAVGLSADDVYKVVVWIVSSNPKRDYVFFNGRWDIAFGRCEIKPVRKFCAVSWLPLDALVEFDFHAVRQCNGNGGCDCHDHEAHPGD